MKTTTNLFLSLLCFLFFQQSILHAQPQEGGCGDTVDCKHKNYPYIFCEPDTFIGGGNLAKLIVRCAVFPNTQGVPIKLRMPLCAKFDPSGGLPEGITAEQIQSSIDKMVNEWNCLCGYETPQESDTICCARVVFDTLKRQNFDNYGNPIGFARTPYRKMKNNSLIPNCDTMPCTRTNTNDMTIVLNLTDEFKKYYRWYVGDTVPPQYSDTSTTDSLRGYSLDETIAHELGHFMGLLHYDTFPQDYAGISADSSDSCKQSGIGIMNATGAATGGGLGKDRIKLSNDDKCYFMKLYCINRTTTGVYEKNNFNYDFTIYPNPLKNGLLRVQYFSGKPKRVFISNSRGEIIYTKEIKNSASSELTVNLPDAYSGSYVLTLEYDRNKRVGRKFVIKK